MNKYAILIIKHFLQIKYIEQQEEVIIAIYEILLSDIKEVLKKHNEETKHIVSKSNHKKD